MASAATTKGCQPSVKGYRRRLCRFTCVRKVPGKQKVSCSPSHPPAQSHHFWLEGISDMMQAQALPRAGKGRREDKYPSDPQTQGTGRTVDVKGNEHIRGDTGSLAGRAASYPLPLVSAICVLSHLQPKHTIPLNIHLLQAGSLKTGSPKESSLKINSSIDQYSWNSAFFWIIFHPFVCLVFLGEYYNHIL